MGVEQSASAEAFERAGLDRPFLLTTIRFEVVETDDGAFITLSTRVTRQSVIMKNTKTKPNNVGNTRRKKKPNGVRPS